MSCNHTQSELTGHLLCVHSEAFADGVQAEQERIIKLYRGWQQQLLASEPYTDKELGNYRDNGYQDSFDYFVALIKEQN